jgi:ornithine cyclodeaminase
MKVFDEAQIRRAIGVPEAVSAIREAFRADGLKRTTVPAVINLPIPALEGEFHVKSAFIEGVPHVAVKVASGFYRNAERGLPTGAGLIMLFDADTGLPEALLLDNAYLTDVRTGAAGAVAAECLARAGIDTVGVLGSGVQARHQLACLREVRAFSRVRCWSRSPAHAASFCAEMRAAGFDAEAEGNPERVVHEADVLVTVTPSREPVVRAEWLRPGLHITAVGSDTPGKQELDARCLSRADLVVADRLKQCIAFGELAHAPGVRVHAELGEIVAGLKPGRTRDDQITIADLTGVGFQDTAIASAAYASLAKYEI